MSNYPVRSQLVAYTNDLYQDKLFMESIPKDVFFRPEYYNLFHDDQAVLYSYVDHTKAFYLPFLKRKIPNKEFYDFESAYGYSGPFSNSNDDQFLSSAWKEFYNKLRDEKYIAGFLRFNPLIQNQELARNAPVNLVSICPIVTMHCDGRTIDDIWNDYDKNTRNKIRKAEKNNLELDIVSDESATDKFSAIYYQTMIRLSADVIYYFQKEFFEQLVFKLNKHVSYLFVRSENEITGGAILLHSDDVMTYFLSATNEDGRKNGSSQFLRHQAIRFALEKNISRINFGGGKTNKLDDSLLKFKMGFSKSLQDFYIGKLIFNDTVYKELCQDWDRVSNQKQKELYESHHLKYRYKFSNESG